MTSLLRWRARVWLLVTVVMVSVVVGSCTCGPSSQPAQERPILACKAQRHAPTVAPPSKAEKRILPGATAISYSTTDSGEVAVSIGMTPVPGRGTAEPSLSLNYNSGNEHEGIVGFGFALSAGSAITRCRRDIATDAHIEPVFFDERDHTSLCLDGRRLVVVGQAGDEIEYRTLPDSNIKVVGYFEDPTQSHFDAFLPDGSIRRYGASAASRPRAKNGMPLKWLLEKEEDARGNGILFDWCFAEDPEGYVAETALITIRYSAFEDEEPQQAVVFSYKQREGVQTTFSRGMQFQESLRLAEVQMQGVNGTLVRRYEFAYEASETTAPRRVASYQECGEDGKRRFFNRET